MNDPRLAGKTALVTGASSGLGADFARQLAARGCHLILVARREERMLALKREITANHDVTIDVIPLDLATRTAPDQLYQQVLAQGRQVDVLINNAGFGIHGDFLTIPWDREEEMLILDIITVVHLTKLFVKDMVARDFGYVLQIASMAAYQPTPTFASYAATKAFVLHFGEALNFELRHTNVHVTVLSPGVTATEFGQVAGQQSSLFHRIGTMDSPTVVRIGLDAMLAQRPSKVAGPFNALAAWSNRLAPRRLSTAIAARLMR